MPVTSRSFHASFCALLCVIMVGCATGPFAKRPSSKLKPWRLVINDDADYQPPANDPDLKKFLNFRFNWIVDTHADAYFLCIASTDRLWPKERATPQDAMNQWAAHGDVPRTSIAGSESTSRRLTMRACRSSWRCASTISMTRGIRS